MFDTDFSEDASMFLGASCQRIHIWQLPSTSDEKSSPASEAPEPFQVIQSPVLSKSLKCTFRAARFGRGSTASRLFTIVNATPHTTSGGPRKGKRSIERKAFITTWDTQSWNLIKTRTVAKKPVTSFDVSPDGRMLALGGADLSVSIFDAETVRVSQRYSTSIFGGSLPVILLLRRSLCYLYLQRTTSHQRACVSRHIRKFSFLEVPTIP